jgi:hypothetical protein
MSPNSTFTFTLDSEIAQQKLQLNYNAQLKLQLSYNAQLNYNFLKIKLELPS